MIQSRRIKWPEQEGRLGEMRKSYKTSVQTSF